MGAGGSHRPCERPAPARRARRAHDCALGVLGSSTPVAHREERAGGAVTPSRVGPVRLAGSSRARAVAVHPVLLPPPLGVHNRRMPGLQGLQGPPRGSGAARGTTRRSATVTQMEHVRAPTFGDALRATKTHPDTPDTLGVRVVTVLGPLVSRWPPRGVASSGHTWPSTRCACPDAGGCSTCCRDPPNHARYARRARGDRARAARKSL